MSYEDAIARLGRALTFGINPSLDGIRTLAEALGRPQDSFRSVQVTGTNGKTSVTRMLGALLRAHGLPDGVYTSPHLVSYTERMEVGGRPLFQAEFASALASVFDVADRRPSHAGAADPVTESTEFELLTAAALVAFRERRVAWACLEVGMGGRWDATSVVDPSVAVITGIALDHTDRLGVTREEIAWDKAHIIKPGSMAVVGPGCAGVEHVFIERALSVGAPLVHVGQGEDDVTWRVMRVPRTPGGELMLEVTGAHGRYRDLRLRAPSYQAPNVATAIAAAECALGGPLESRATREALAEIVFPGRFELLRDDPPLVIDGAHNPEAAGVLAKAIREAFGDGLPVVVLGILRDKDVSGIVAALVPAAREIVCTENGSPRCLPAADLASVVESLTGMFPLVEPDLGAAIMAAGVRSAEAGVVVTGSLYTAGAARGLFC